MNNLANKKLQGILPIILSVAFIMAIVILAIKRLMDWKGTMLYLGVAIVVIYILWLFDIHQFINLKI